METLITSIGDESVKKYILFIYKTAKEVYVMKFLIYFYYNLIYGGFSMVEK